MGRGKEEAGWVPSAPALASPSWVSGPRGGQQHPEAAAKGPSRQQPAASSWPWLLGRKPRGAAACARLELVSAITCVLLTPFGAGIRLPSPTHCINENKSSAIHCGTRPMRAGTAQSNAEAPLPPSCPERQVTACPPVKYGAAGHAGWQANSAGAQQAASLPSTNIAAGSCSLWKATTTGPQAAPCSVPERIQGEDLHVGSPKRELGTPRCQQEGLFPFAVARRGVASPCPHRTNAARLSPQRAGGQPCQLSAPGGSADQR